jgi:heme-degrading monooxygenase HmoA
MPTRPSRSKKAERAARAAARVPAHPLIARVWHGVVPTERADAYTAYLRRTGVKDCRATPGNRGVHVLRRAVGPTTHFLFISFWESLDAIRGFAGEDIDRARYYPEDRTYLLELEPTVTHHEAVEG